HKTYPCGATIQQLFEQQVVLCPDQIAVTHEDQSLTYGELNRYSEKLALFIRELYRKQKNSELPSDTLIALYFNKSIEMVVSILAVLKAGAAYVPLSPEHPKERIDYQQEDTNAPLLLTQESYYQRLSEWLPELEKVNGIISVKLDALAKQKSREILNNGSERDLAYVIYTSGTTGNPKGVMIEHRSVVNLVRSQTEALDFANDEKVVWLPAYIFDGAVEVLWVTLLNGAHLIIPTEEDLQSPECIDRYQMTHLVATPAYLAALGQLASAHKIRRVVSGGDVFPAELKALWGSKLVNVYGPTEATVTATRCLNYAEHKQNNRIGKPIDNVMVYVLSPNMKPVPIGSPGELYLGGMGIARGYLNQEKLTQERFVNNPFVPEGGERLYRTGDLVRWLPDGDLEYLGRDDNQVKIRGFRVELGEVEAAIQQLPNIRQAIVISYEHEQTNYLIAYVVAESCMMVDQQTIKQALSTKLPSYMVPTVISLIDKVPLTVNGKLDRQQLPQVDLAASKEYVAPENNLQEKLCQIWASVLGLKRVGITDNFFSIGGHSINAIRIVSLIRQQLDMEVPLSLFYAKRTIAELSEGLGKNQKIEIPRLGLERYPLSFAQQRLLFIEQLEQGTDAYHIPFFAKLNSGTDYLLVRTAIEEICKRHSILSTIYVDNEQVVQAGIPCWESEQLKSQEQLNKYLQSAISQPFDLSSEPSIRLKHFQLSGTNYLLIVWHHIAFDGWS
ncbi:non-ribosomal peptide synthetase, partial [Aliikangiella sp. G2MR2-5]|uniref:non-ribosomal peptide synthetase n=1 Tax=Aliikangiella sp. G2MR2-5 TaxID=2788943 RepID=UPI0018AB591A